MNDKDIIAKIDNIDKVSQSELDRGQLQILLQNDLINFMRTFMNKMTSESELKTAVEEEMLRRVMDAPEDVSMSALIRVMEVLNKHNNEGSIGLLSVLKESQKIIINNNEGDGLTETPVEDDLTKEDLQVLKKLRKVVKETEKAEASSEEIKKKSLY